jgi:hypothetical protein
MRATTALNSTNNIKKTTSIPTKLVNNIDNNNNIKGVDNGIQNEENSEDTDPKRRRLRQRIIPKIQKLKYVTPGEENSEETNPNRKQLTAFKL